ncbi:16S rRNA (cytidine(1402)-2'-O)-methyltransferase [Thermodesulforhabdus norvegica]|uniref:Ribosomal RNA small subunit methyltransferase I n=1 Tax=Thermodesulforhabdus norvegica TaxID=39841 RepID=A0A1I4QYM0_9BACT|nr:16S rRNA (cytidine(1402)-2'-O)-methyltransferase [Thermodesulforhabdus norvegica]SFM45119.1 16S rRNA (cytidine1402-2'-O)-methyltransferase [Thermodesulforhabdus norvegica]
MFYVVGTPIGNLKDITLRALEVLRSADVIYAEDTRITRKLLSAYDIHVPLRSFHEHSPEGVDEVIIKGLEKGLKIVLVTDAGMPGFSDPGYRIIRKVIERNLPMTVVPGPSALLCALLLSGFPPYPFAFLGFPPPKGKARQEFFRLYEKLPMTVVLFESPHRIGRTLEDILNYWGDRPMVLAREMTKVHEEVLRGSVRAIAEALKDRGSIRGEITLVVSPGSERSNAAENGAGWEVELAKRLENPDAGLSDIVKSVSRDFGVPRNLVYRKALSVISKDSDNNP